MNSVKIATWEAPVSNSACVSDVEFPPGWSFPLSHAFGENNYEREIFRTHFAGSDITLQGLFNRVLAFRGPDGLPRARWQGPGFPPHDARVVRPDDQVCVHCALDLLEASLFDWWLSERSTADLPDGVLSREDCWYGIDCRTARHNMMHARNLNHICLPTRTGGETQGDPPENGHRTIVEEARTIDVYFPAYSPSDVIFRDAGNETVFMCSSVCEDEVIGDVSVIPGKLTVWGARGRTLVYYAMDGEECWHDGRVEILKDVRNMRWVRTSKGVVPEGCRPVVGGHTTIDGSREVLHHCAVWWCGQRVPGYASPRTGRAVITWDGHEWYIENEYELLCWN
ncbi:E3 ubiquitin-protein ligase CHFR [Ceratobasidium sp. AG-Ba]|nr:E3 ubiquitin-protein ligase CHFR [Ceratobasidium sp. AG-Ba]